MGCSIYCCCLLLFLIFNVGMRVDTCRDEDNLPITTCKRCIWRPHCVWCLEQSSIDQTVGNCIKKGDFCGGKLITPQKKHPLKEQEVPLQFTQPFVQLTPQRVSMTMIPQQEQFVSFDIALADIPVDIYFVMDQSYSMKEHKKNLQETTNKLAVEIDKLTPNFRIGFGSFSDKPTPPFAADISYYRSEKHRPTPYAFHHQLALTKNTTDFRRKVADAITAGNVDSPESGLDALMQALTCEHIIGWNKEVRRVVIFITDKGPHYALDGQLAGIPQPNDGLCHTEQARSGRYEYVKQLDQDYPSFTQIRQKLSTGNMPVVIFAVDKKMVNLYKKLSVFIQGTDNVGELTSDATSLINIVTHQYRAIKSRIKVRKDWNRKAMSVKFTSTCPNEDYTDNQMICSGLEERQTVRFNATVKITEELCLKESGDAYIEIGLDGFPNDKLDIFVDCQKCYCPEVRPVADAESCNRHGNLICGGCNCHPGFAGKNCECNLKTLGREKSALNKQCFQSGTMFECNGFGECQCGVCRCDAQHLGQFCQCLTELCPRDERDQICAGHGTCSKCTADRKPMCQCEDGWTGLNCDCQTSTSPCVDVFSGQECFGNGKCECGECTCQDGFEGKYCQKNTAISTCKKLEPCIKLDQFARNVSTGQATEWESLCNSYTTKNGIKMFGRFIDVGCNINSTIEENNNEYVLSLVYEKSSQPGNCEQLVKTYLATAGRVDDESEGRRIGGGDQPGYLVERGRLITTSGMDHCTLDYDGCRVTYFHTGLEKDNYFDPSLNTLGSIFVVYHNISDEDSKSHKWTPVARCQTNVALAIIMTTSILLPICLILLISGVVIVNLNDHYAWKRYMAMREANEAKLSDHLNPMYEGKTTTTTNPAYDASN